MTVTGGDERRRTAPPPEGVDALLAMPVHRIVMEWPETLERFAERGILPGAAGGQLLGSVPHASRLARSLLKATAWRSG